MIIRRKTREIAKKHVHKKLLFKLRRFALTGSIIFLIIVYDILKKIIPPLLSLSGIVLGFLIGAVVGRYANIRWHEETSKVVSKLDRTGIAVLILYLCFAFSRKWFFGHWLQGHELTAFGFSIAAGVMAGRIITIRKQIRVLLREKGLLKKEEH